MLRNICIGKRRVDSNFQQQQQLVPVSNVFEEVKVDPKEKISSLSSSPPSLSPIRVGEDLLLGAMRHLTRAHLDAMPLVGRHFYATTTTSPKGEASPRKNATSFLPQRRLLGEIFIGEWGLAHLAPSFCRLYTDAKYPRLFSTFRTASSGDGKGGVRYELSEADLSFLLSHSQSQSPHQLLAKFTTICVPSDSHQAAALFAEVKKQRLTSLWDGSRLEIHSGNAPRIADLAAVVGNCTRLEVCGCILPHSTLSDPAVMRCPSISCYLEGDMQGRIIGLIANYLVPSSKRSRSYDKAAGKDGKSGGNGGDGMMRKLSAHLSVPNANVNSYAPTLIKHLLEQRIETAASSSTAFCLDLFLVYVHIPFLNVEVGKFMLMRTVSTTATCSGTNNGNNDEAISQTCGSFTVQHFGNRVYHIEAKMGGI